MSDKSQRMVIFLIIGVFMVSILGTALLVLGGGEDATDEEIAASLQEQAAEQAAQQQAQEELLARQQACSPLPRSSGLPELTVPAFDLPSGDVTELVTNDLVIGAGNEVQPGDCIIANYHGVTSDGTVFDSSFERGEPNRFPLTGVIEGWQLGIPGMREGGTRLLYIPSEQGYGEFGSAPLIGPNQDLVFVVELVEISQ